MKQFSLFMFLMLVLMPAIAQDLNQAREAYNKGAEAYNNKEYETAINSFNECLDICAELGPEGEEVKMQAEMQLPEVYISYAKSIYKEDIDKAIEAAENAAEIAAGTSNISSREKADKLASRLYNGKGKKAYKAKKMDQALEYFGKAIEKDSSYSEAYFLIGVVYKTQDDEDNFKKTMLMAKKVADQNNDNKVLQKVVGIGKTYFYNKAIKAQKENQLKTAKQKLNTSLEFDEEFENAYYLLSLINNELNSYDESIEAAEKALELNNGTDADKAKIYFELGRAYQGKNNKEAACDAYQKSMHGAYLKSAEYQRKHALKCSE